MDIQEINNQIERLEKLIGDKTAEKGEEFKKELSEKYEALLNEQAGKIKLQQTQLDSLEGKIKGLPNPQESQENEIISKELFDKLQHVRNKSLNYAAGEINLPIMRTKATMTAANNYTGVVVQPFAPETIYNNPFADPARARNLVANGTTGVTDSVTFTVGAVAATDAPPASVAPGSDKPENEFDFTATNFPIETIAATVRATNQMLADKAQLESWIRAVMVQRLLNEEDDQIINGDGTNNTLEGLIANATTVTQANSGAATDATAQAVDAIRAGISYLALARYRPDSILLNPADFYNIIGLKDADEAYLNKMLTYDNLGQVRLYGIPLIAHNAVPADQCVLGALRQCYMYMIREGLSVEFFREDRDNVLKNLTTIRAEMRAVGVPILPAGIAHFDISTLVADLQA